MSYEQPINQPPIGGLENIRKADEPCTIVIFGASGDLTSRKLIPALYPPVFGWANARFIPCSGFCSS